MEVAPRYKVHCLYTVYSVCTVQTALHCFYSNMFGDWMGDGLDG